MGVPERRSDSPNTRVSEVLNEVRHLPTDKAKKNLLHHQFRAQVKEEVGLPFHTFAMVLRHEGVLDPQFHLHDDAYHWSLVTERCQRAIAVAQNKTEHDRYQLELEQILKLEYLINEQLVGFDHALLADMANEKLGDKKNREMTAAHLYRLGWQDAPLILPELDQRLKLPDLSKCIVGPKFFYIMPKSPVHKGWQTMYLIAQPAYLPDLDRWVVIQDQHMARAEWQEYDQILTLAGEYVPIHSSRQIALKEIEVMSQCLQLESNYQTLPAQEVFLDLIYRRRGKQDQVQRILASQQKLLQVSDHLEESFDLHSDYLLKVLKLEENWEPTWTPTKKERLFQAYFNTYSSLYHKKPITATQSRQWFKHYQQLYQDQSSRQSPFEQRSAHRLLAATAEAPWLLLSIQSQLECSLLAVSGLMKNNLDPHLLNAIQTNSLTFSQLESVIGKERAKRWKLGKCVACKAEPVWIGDKFSGKECDVCLACERNAASASFATPNISPSTSLDPRTTKFRTPHLHQEHYLEKSINLTRFLAGDLGLKVSSSSQKLAS